MQNGGCHPVDKCQGPHPFPGAKFHYLAASTIEKATGKTIFPPYEIREFDGIPVAFIGLTLKGTPDIISPVSAAGLEFRDEADTVNALVPELKARGVEAIVVLIHEGGFPTGDYNECSGDFRGDRRHRQKIRPRGRRRDQRPHPSGLCLRDRRTARHLGRQIRHPRHRDRPQARSHHAATSSAPRPTTSSSAPASLPKDPEQTALLEAYDQVAAPIANRRAGSITRDAVAHAQ